jgi:hypothetical protein
MLQLECLLSDFHTKMSIHWLPIFVRKNFKSGSFDIQEKNDNIFELPTSNDADQLSLLFYFCRGFCLSNVSIKLFGNFLE